MHAGGHRFDPGILHQLGRRGEGGGQVLEEEAERLRKSG